MSRNTEIGQHEAKPRRTVVWRATAGVGFAAAAIAAVAVATSNGGAPAPAPVAAAPKAATTTAAVPAEQEAPLVQLVSYLSKAEKPTGDATLVLRDQHLVNGKTVDVWDLFGDNGNLYFAKTRAGMPAQVKGNHIQVHDDKVGQQQVVAAAKYAATGDLNEARKRMAMAYVPQNSKVKHKLLPPGFVPPAPTNKNVPAAVVEMAQINTTDNWVWNNSMDALQAGAGNPAVRAGVLRLLGQMPEVKVTKSTVGGQAVLVLTAHKPVNPDPETLTVDAATGLPIKYANAGTTVNYTVTRVTLADVAKGKF
ncbi:hypothetical protein ACQPZJ_00965 [Actinoplanes sp. CA-054009]